MGEPARALRNEGMGQAPMYRLFSELHQRISGADPRRDATVDLMDLIWSGPCAVPLPTILDDVPLTVEGR